MPVQYNFNQQDKDFIYELTKVGRVDITSSQVTLSPKNRTEFQVSNAFPDGIKLPNNWVIQYMGSSDSGLYLTFQVKGSTPSEQAQ
jgi:hypothetical protein